MTDLRVHQANMANRSYRQAVIPLANASRPWRCALLLCARLIGPYVRHVRLFSTSLDVIEKSEDASRQTTWPSPYQSASLSLET